ncbi:MAG: AI-2E family transporter, partial [Clostridia bacterium]|nr:AI-2E family transporter [Clostridia bacterium]
MEFSKKTWNRLLLLVVLALLIAFGLQHLDEVLSGISAIFAILSPIFTGICIAFIVNVPMRPLETVWNKLFLRHPKEGRGKIRTALRRPVCLILSFLLIAGLLFAVVFLLIPQLGKAFRDFAAMMPGYLSDLEALWVQLQTFLGGYGFVLPDFAIDISRLNTDSIFNTVKDFFAQWGTHILDTTVSITTTVFSGVFNVVLALVFSIYMLAQKEMLCHQLHRILLALFSESRVEKITAFADLVNKTFTNFITGQLTEAVIIGVLCGIGMAILRMPYAFVVSVIVGFTALIPVFGAYVGTAIGAFLILLAQPIKAVWFVIFIIVLQQVEGNL